MNLSKRVGRDMVAKGYARKVVQCRNFTTACAIWFADNTLDFIFVDARHDRKGVLQDLKVYWPKLKEGGVIAGHDYTEQKEPPVYEGIKYFGCDLKKYQSPATMGGQDWTLNYDGSRDASGRAVKGAVDDFFSGV